MSAATTALSLDRNLTSVHVTLGRLYTETGKNDLASQELNEALRLDANNAEAFHGLAELYQKQGRNDEVEPALRKAADLAPDDWRFPDALGSFLSKRGQFEKALTLHLQAVSITPDNARALNNLGAAYSRLGRFAEAQQTIEKAIHIEPGFNRYNNLGTILQNQGKYAEAQQSSDAAKKWALWSTIIGLVVLVIYGILYATGSIAISHSASSSASTKPPTSAAPPVSAEKPKPILDRPFRIAGMGWELLTPGAVPDARADELMALDEAASRALLDIVAPWLHKDGIALTYDQPTRWLARGTPGLIRNTAPGAGAITAGKPAQSAVRSWQSPEVLLTVGC